MPVPGLCNCRPFWVEGWAGKVTLMHMTVMRALAVWSQGEYPEAPGHFQGQHSPHPASQGEGDPSAALDEPEV